MEDSVMLKVGDIVMLNPNVGWKEEVRKKLLKLKMRIIKVDKNGYIHLETIEGEFPDKKKRGLCINPEQLIKVVWRIA